MRPPGSKIPDICGAIPWMNPDVRRWRSIVESLTMTPRRHEPLRPRYRPFLRSLSDGGRCSVTRPLRTRERSAKVWTRERGNEVGTGVINQASIAQTASRNSKRGDAPYSAEGPTAPNVGRNGSSRDWDWNPHSGLAAVRGNHFGAVKTTPVPVFNPFGRSGRSR